MLKKYADLLVNYCVNIQKGEKLYISTTTLAEPLVKEIYRSAYKAGASVVEVEMAFQGKYKIMMDEAGEDQLKFVSPFNKLALETFDAYIHIRAPFNLYESTGIDKEKAKIRAAASLPLHQVYMKRTGTLDLKRNLCQFPTIAAAQNAGMSLEQYEKFIFNACNLFEEDPIQAWLNVRKEQQKATDLLNTKENIRYKGPDFDLIFSTKGRVWINSDGQTNMPSGEVYTSPVEDSVNGNIYFSHMGIYGGNEVEGVRLYVKDGYIEKWEAKRGMAYLNYIFALPGTRRFGEAAIGTNRNIQQITKNILFDEKIGGTIHMAIGQSYKQCGGKNESAVHWDMITDMTQGGEIYADDELIYKNGNFIF